MHVRSAVVGGIVALSLGGCYSSKSTTSTSSTTTPVSSSTVTIQNMAFSPASITVPTGTIVTWTNNDSVTHTVTGTGNGAPNGFNSGNLASGTTYSFTFTDPGTYTYQCTIHPSMTGTVIVQ